ncbi:hypothetical protein lbkm_4251 [Lachnospiraceae bacterium KM106-2]|nr:hypothetical protein lbkm_4251 [Lachnospiraceae bacterium KM106-2]
MTRKRRVITKFCLNDLKLFIIYFGLMMVFFSVALLVKKGPTEGTDNIIGNMFYGYMVLIYYTTCGNFNSQQKIMDYSASRKTYIHYRLLTATIQAFVMGVIAVSISILSGFIPLFTKDPNLLFNQAAWYEVLMVTVVVNLCMSFIITFDLSLKRPILTYLYTDQKLRQKRKFGVGLSFLSYIIVAIIPVGFLDTIMGLELAQRAALLVFLLLFMLVLYVVSYRNFLKKEY